MIKGVNKQVLEISQTDSNFFEKAIFFVKPEYMGMSEGKLREIAENQLQGVGLPPVLKKRKKTGVGKVALFCLLFLTGVALGMIISSFQ